jgi:hypothetical protein
MVCGLATEVLSRPLDSSGKGWNFFFLYRMAPHIFGYVPMIGAWVMMIKFLETVKMDVERDRNAQMPLWVNFVVYGTVVIFWSFSVVQIVFQYRDPLYYGEQSDVMIRRGRCWRGLRVI